MASLTLFGGSEVFDLRIGLEILRGILRLLIGRVELKEASVKEHEQKAFVNGFWWGSGITAVFLICLFAATASASSRSL